jgi:hypothetical protein
MRSFSKVIICNGMSLKVVSKLFLISDLVVSKLQMMQTKPQKNYTLDGSILTGLSIRDMRLFMNVLPLNQLRQKKKTRFRKKWGDTYLVQTSIRWFCHFW